MDGFELNKIAAAVFVSGLIALMIGNVVEGVLYVPENPEKRGYQVEVVEAQTTGEAEVEPEPVDVAALLLAADSAKGEKLFKQCATCHTSEAGGAHRVGPALWGVLGRQMAAADGYKYSSALKEKAAEVVSWSEEELYHFIKKPRKYAKGTKMGYAGMKKDQDLADLIAYMQTLR